MIGARTRPKRPAIRAEATAPATQAEALGVAVAENLLAQGADRILADVYGG